MSVINTYRVTSPIYNKDPCNHMIKNWLGDWSQWSFLFWQTFDNIQTSFESSMTSLISLFGVHRRVLHYLKTLSVSILSDEEEDDKNMFVIVFANYNYCNIRCHKRQTDRQCYVCALFVTFLPQGKRNPMNYCICWHFCLKLELLRTHKKAYRQLMK